MHTHQKWPPREGKEKGQQLKNKMKTESEYEGTCITCNLYQVKICMTEQETFILIGILNVQLQPYSCLLSEILHAVL